MCTLSREPAFVVTTRATKTAVAPRLIEAQAVVAAIFVAVTALLEILNHCVKGKSKEERTSVINSELAA
jgi:hypothetical protein